MIVVRKGQIAIGDTWQAGISSFQPIDGVYYVPSTPGTVSVDREYDDLFVNCTKPGAQPYSMQVKSKTKGLAFGNIILGGIIGAGVDMVPVRDAITTAKEVATLDSTSNGRLEFGIGYGWIPIEGFGGIVDHIPKLREAFDTQGRDPQTAIVSVYSSLGDEWLLAQYQHANVHRVVLTLPSADETTVMTALDGYARAVENY